MLWFLLLLFLTLGTVLSWSLIYLILNSKFKDLFTSELQPHHTHVNQTARLGGIGIIFGMVASFVLLWILFKQHPQMNELTPYAILVGAIGCFLLGFFDDIKPVGAVFKFLIQVLIAIFAHQCGLSIDRIFLPFIEANLDLSSFSLILTVIWFVSIINLMNLIDGLDGLAGGIGLMLMVLLVILGIDKNLPLSVFLAMGMAGAVLGFLIHNFPPARVYMGDSGAYTIGFMIAALSLMNFQKGAVLAALLGPMLAMALPIIDVAFALIRRSIQGLPLFRPDKEHIHHQLIRSGISHKKTVLILYGVSLIALVGGVLIFSNQGRYFPLFIGFSSVIVIFTFRMNQGQPSSFKKLFTDSLESRYEVQNAVKLSKWFVSEVDRVRVAEDQWSDFRWVLKKIGFQRVILQVGFEQRIYESVKEAQETLESAPFKLDSLGPGSFIQFYVDKQLFTERRFKLVSDIAYETWLIGCKKWMDLNQSKYTFDSIANKHENTAIENARDLYMP
tara:strand:+ start:791 stop:2296 length:1506 start_codon:yes stop_codon:yes gene_type:complete